MSRLRTSCPWISAVLALAVCQGCSVGGDSPPTPLPEDAGADAQAYPASPYGVDVGAVISNFDFTGYAQPDQSVGQSHRVPISLGDFYNPTGEGTFPEGSPFGEGQDMPRALVINVGAVWCVSCQLEAQNVLPGEYDHYQPLGAEFLFNLAEAIEPGTVAGWQDLELWVHSFPVRYPSVIDPTYQLGALLDSSSFPANIIVDTSDMTIVELIMGVPQDSFWAKVDNLLNAG